MSEGEQKENTVITAEQNKLKTALLSLTEDKSVGSPERIALADIYAHYLSQQEVRLCMEEVELIGNEPLQIGRYTAAVVSFNQLKRDIRHRAAAISGYAVAYNQINDTISRSWLTIHDQGEGPSHATYVVSECLEDTSKALGQYVAT
ncbi:hypothetical protein M1437_03440 [Patescibacteria group bacterium]|nr:hypothetical protein [Patescibacteria group bacterium]